MLKAKKFLNKQKYRRYLSSPRFLLHYRQIIYPDFILQYPLDNLMQIPCIEKIVLNWTSKAILQHKKTHLPASLALDIISGQKSKNTWARKSIAAFKLRENSILGCKVTLRATSMYFFLEKLMTQVLPRVKQHQDYTKEKHDNQVHCYLDENGNYNVGISDPFFFRDLETNFEFFKSLRGFNVTLVTSKQQIDKILLIFNSLQIPVSY